MLLECTTKVCYFKIICRAFTRYTKVFVMFWNSVGMTVSILIGQLVVSVTAAWGFARYEFPYKKLLFTLYIVLMLMPFQVTMLSTYLVLDKIKLINTAMSIVLPAVFYISCIHNV